MTVHAPSALPADAVKAVRAFLIGSSVIGIVLGIVALAWPKATLLVVGVLFGAALVVAGLIRLFLAFAFTSASFLMRMVLAILGGVVLAAGVLAVLNPAKSLVLLGVFIGVGWILSGVQDLFGVRLTGYLLPRWLVIVSGLISVFAGIAMIVLPAVYTLSTIIWILAVMLIAVSVATLLSLPGARTGPSRRERKQARADAKDLADEAVDDEELDEDPAAETDTEKIDTEKKADVAKKDVAKKPVAEKKLDVETVEKSAVTETDVDLGK